MTKNNFFSVAISLFLLLTAANNVNAQESPAKNQESDDYKITFDKVDASKFSNTAVVQGLNKTTAKTSILEIKIGQKVNFGRLTITAHKCWQAPLDQRPENKILLEISEEQINETDKSKTNKRIFYGWMFSSSPSLSSLEHPVYDITAISCKR